MATVNQIRASQSNGARSRGPVTVEGKNRSAQNSTKHGAYSKAVVLNNEDPALYDEFRDEILAAWSPADGREYLLVMDIVDARWRLNRFAAFETAALDFEIERMRPELDEHFESMDECTRSTLGFNSLITLNKSFEVLQTAQRNQHRIIDRATTQLLRLQKARATARSAESAEAAPQPRPELEIPANEPERAASESVENRGNEPESIADASNAVPSVNDLIHIFMREWVAANIPHSLPSGDRKAA